MSGRGASKGRQHQARIAWALVVIVGLPLIAGCLGGEPSSEPADAAPSPTDPFVADVPIYDAEFRATSQSGDAVAIAAMAWLEDPAPSSVVVLVHGLSGVKENYFHTLPERGADLGGRLAATGRAVFALDMIGYGESYGPRTGVTMDEQAFVLDQVVQALRRGDYVIDGADPVGFDAAVAYGLSMGGAIVDITQGRHGTFDAIMPAGASHKGPTRESLSCFRMGDECPEPPHDDFVVERADPEVVNATLAGYEDLHAASYASLMEWYGACGGPAGLPGEPVPCQRPTPYDVNAEGIEVPVLSILGTEDRIIDTSDADNEPSYFPNSPDARVIVLDGIGHFVHNHLIQPELVEQMDAWMDELGY